MGESKKFMFKLGVAAVDKTLGRQPMLLSSDKYIEASSFEEACSVFLSDPTVSKIKANDLVMLLSIGSKG